MPMDIFKPTQCPDADLSVPFEPRFIEGKFGDGYVQEMPDGINTVQREVRPKWTNMAGSLADVVIAFLEGKAATREPFLWTPNGEKVQRVWKCMQVTHKFKKGRFCDIDATFKETAARA